MTIDVACPTDLAASRRRFLRLALLPAAATLIGAKATPRRASKALHRRVVVGLDANGKSAILSDGIVPEGARAEDAGRSTTDLWLLKSVPADLGDESDPMKDYELTAWPPPGGAVARIATWPPGFQYPMHASDTLDVIFVIKGAIELIAEGGSTILHPGDSVIQQGTKHSWRVVGSEPATFAGVLISGVRKG